MNTIITAQCLDQTLTLTNSPKLASGGENVFRVELTFDSRWDGYGKEAVCYKDKTRIYHVVMVDDTFIIPWELTAKPGRVHFSVRGVRGSMTRTSEEVILSFVQGAPLENNFPEPTPDIYKQVLSAYGSVSAEVAVERARIDQLTKLEDGSTTGDAELQDIRVGADGTTYSTAGDAVRGQSATLKNAARYALERGTSDEVIPTELVPGYINSSGSLVSPGEDTLEMTTGHIVLQPDDILRFEVCGGIPDGDEFWAALSLYEADGSFATRWAFAEPVYYYNNTGEYHTVRYSARTYGRAFVAVTRKNMEAISNTILPAYHAHNYDYVPLTWHNGYYENAGNTQIAAYSTACEVRSELIAVKPGDKFRLVSEARHNLGDDPTGGYRHWAAIATFDESRAFLARNNVYTVTGDAQPYVIDAELTIPAGVSYIAVCGRTYWDAKYSLARIVEETSTATGYDCDTVVRGVAHRGASGYAPENTLAAYREAKRRGFRYVECDVQFTADGVAVLCHDATVDRTSTGSGNVSGKTLAELRSLDFGSWFSAEYVGEVIPTFTEFIALCRKLSLHPYIEIKSGTQTQIEGLADTVKSYGMEHKVTWIGSSAYLAHIMASIPDSRVGIVVGSVTDGNIQEAVALKAGDNEVFMDSSSYTEEEVALCKANGIGLEVWTVNDANTIISLPEYVSGVTSDYYHAGRVLSEDEMSK